MQFEWLEENYLPTETLLDYFLRPMFIVLYDLLSIRCDSYICVHACTSNFRYKT